MKSSNTEIRNPTKPGKASLFLAALILSFDGLTALLYGLIFLYSSGGVPPPDISVEAQYAEILLGHILAFLCFAYPVMCFISLNYWRKGKRTWGYVILGLGLIHIVGSLGFTGFSATLSDVSFFLNIFLLAIIITGRIWSASRPEQGGTDGAV